MKFSYLFIMLFFLKVTLVIKGAGTPVPLWSNDDSLIGLTQEEGEKKLKKFVEQGLYKADRLGATLLHWAARLNKPDYVQLLIQKGIGSMVRDQKGNTPLHWAAAHNSPEALFWLMKMGARPELMNNEKKTALHLSASAPCTRLLLIAGAQVVARDSKGRTPLHYAPDIETAELLINRGADPTAEDEKSHMTARMALENGRYELFLHLAPLLCPLGPVNKN